MRRLVFSLLLVAAPLAAHDLAAGKKQFQSRCAPCHGADGTGGEMGPNIGGRLRLRNDQQLSELIHKGIPDRGMPPNAVEGADLANLLAFTRTLERRGGRSLEQRSVTLTSGKTVEGLVLGEGFEDLQLQTADKKVLLLRRAGAAYREVTSQTDWPTYNGETGGNRFTSLTNIDQKNVGQLSARWTFQIPNGGQLQMTPVVVGGIMYVTAPNFCYALDAGSGRQIWKYEVPRTPEAAKSTGPNRGVGIAGDRLFMETYSAHLIALNRFTGELLWDSPIADPSQNYFATSAPLPAGDLVISGVGGGEHGANGFVAAFSQSTGKEVWRFSAVPKRGEPGSETWKGRELDHGGAPTWFTGSYDSELDTVYWPTGNPSEEYNGDNRPGDNLYSDCILALDRKTGKLKWHYQFTPHDLWDWDATETSVVVNAEWQGKPRKLLLHADRNGFFYVFDRLDGKLLLAKQFLRNVTWASAIGADGRPVKLPGQEPSEAGTKVCPSQDGATNWFSPSYNPVTGLYYFQTFEKCSFYVKSENETWAAGRTYLGGSQRTAPDPKPVRELKALDIRTGKVVWTVPQPGPAQSWGGTLSTASGLVFFGEEGGQFMAISAKDGAKDGKPLWSFATNQLWKASPMTYSFDSEQYIAVAAGSDVMAFALPSQH
jgi:alcohol dehydrogenase (cytochrome c)